MLINVSQAAPAAVNVPAWAGWAGSPEAAVTVCVGVLAALIAIWGIITQRLIASRQATLNFIQKSESDRDLIEARRTFNQLDVSAMLSLIESPNLNSDQIKVREQVRLVLNELELVSIAIQSGTLDFPFYRQFYRGTVIKVWGHSAPFVYRLRALTSNSLIYHELEEMFGWMTSTKSPPRKLSWWRRFYS